MSAAPTLCSPFPNPIPPPDEGTLPFKVPFVFHNPDADLVVRSSDQLDFRVYKLFLVEASTVLQNMFHHPQLACEEGLNAVPWNEKASTISLLLQYIYPIGNPKPESLDEITLMVAADKWDINIALSALIAQLLSSSFLEMHLLRVYRLADMLNLADLKLVATRKAIETDLLGVWVR